MEVYGKICRSTQGVDKQLKKIYLSGGTVTGWQDRVISELEELDVDFYNPARLVLGPLDKPEPRIYSPMDKTKIAECDIIFGYLEKTNPTPINVALEFGYAIGLGKRSVLCNEWTADAFEKKELKCLMTDSADGKACATWFKPHYVELLNDWVDFVEPDFGIAIEILKKVVIY